jgi:hypothetical protein
MAAIADTDQGKYDGNTKWDRAVGPMQFIPGSWNAFGADGNGDGVKDPHNVFDASRAAADYLCSNGSNLSTPQGLVQAVLRYNHSMDYVNTVLRWMQSYSKSTTTIPDDTGVIDPTIDDNGNVQRDSDPTHVPTGTTTSHPSTSPTKGANPTTAPTTVPTTSKPVTTPTTTPTKTLPTSPRPSSPKPPWTVSPTPRPTPSDTPTTTPTSPSPSPTPTDTPLPQCDTPTATPTETPSPTPTPTCTPAPQGDPSEAPSTNSTPEQAPTTP